jgi:IgA Peptidase M64
MKITLSVFFAIACITAKAQTFPVDTLFKNGKLEDQINIVFLSDGYQSTETSKYITDVNTMLAVMFNQAPFKNYKSYFNAFAIKVPSTESGAIHPQNTTDSDCPGVPKVPVVNNYFGSTFDYAGIHRLLAVTKLGLAATTLATNFPQYDLAFVMVNSPYYGGSGGGFASSSTHPSSAEVSIHEIGHSFGFLADEYWAGPSYAVEKPNLTMQSDPLLVKWKNWIGIGGVGVYAHAESPTWFRPHQACKMRALGNPFCNVCTEAIVERIHSLTKPLLLYEPKASTIELAKDAIPFSLSLLKPTPNTLSIQWKKDNVVVAKNVESLLMKVSDFINKETIIKATVMDTTSLSKSSTHITTHVYSVEWTVKKTDPVTGIEIASKQKEYEIEIFPNPIEQQLNFAYTLPTSANTIVSLVDMNGRYVKTLVNKRQESGRHAYQFPSDVLPVPGLYFITFSFDDLKLTERIIKK